MPPVKIHELPLHHCPDNSAIRKRACFLLLGTTPDGEHKELRRLRVVLSPDVVMHRKARGELIRRYVTLQRDIMNANPGSSAYRATIGAFRQMGHVMIKSGFEDDVDRLLRFRIIDGGRARSEPRTQKNISELYLLERRGTV